MCAYSKTQKCVTVCLCVSACFSAYDVQDEVVQLRARLSEADEKHVEVTAATSQKLAASAEAVSSMRAHVSDLEVRLEEAETDLSAMREEAASTAAELAVAVNRARDGLHAIARVSELEAVAAALESDKKHLEESLAAATRRGDEAGGKVEADKKQLRQSLEAATKQADGARERVPELEAIVVALESEKSELRDSLEAATRQVYEAGGRVEDMEGEKKQLKESLAVATRQAEEAGRKVEEVEEALRVVRDGRAEMLESVQRADDSRATLAARLEDIASLVG